MEAIPYYFIKRIPGLSGTHHYIQLYRDADLDQTRWWACWDYVFTQRYATRFTRDQAEVWMEKIDALTQRNLMPGQTVFFSIQVVLTGTSF